MDVGNILVPSLFFYFNFITHHCTTATGSYQSKVGECYLFSVKLNFEKAKEYRKSYVAYLRKN